MEVTEILLSVLIGVFSAALTCFLWQRLQLGHRKETTSSPAAPDSSPVADTQLEQPTITGKPEPTGGDGTIRSDDSGMTMKERFYLFLEKGFCPELEQGVKDPLYECYGGKLGNAIGSDAVEGEASLKKEVDGLEEMMLLAKSTGGKCPFSFGQSSASESKSKECPFGYGLKEGADSEEEADVPAAHKTNSSCPLNKKLLANSAEDQVTKESLTADDLEAQVLEEQIKMISKLLAAQEGTEAQDTTELRSQLKLYIQ